MSWKKSSITQIQYFENKNVNIRAKYLLVISFLALVFSQHYSWFICEWVCVYRYLLSFIYLKWQFKWYFQLFVSVVNRFIFISSKMYQFQLKLFNSELDMWFILQIWTKGNGFLCQVFEVERLVISSTNHFILVPNSFLKDSLCPHILMSG